MLFLLPSNVTSCMCSCLLFIVSNPTQHLPMERNIDKIRGWLIVPLLLLSNPINF